jgi:hypothetical protein
MTAPTANQDVVDGYLDGRKDDRLELPDSLSNRGRAYRHGWLSGLADRTGKHLAGNSRAEIEAAAEKAMRDDELP